jgi:hypothetical protein
MEPLAHDTSLDIDQRQIEAWRPMLPAQKAALVISANRAADAMALAGIASRFPESTPRENFCGSRSSSSATNWRVALEPNLWNLWNPWNLWNRLTCSPPTRPEPGRAPGPATAASARAGRLH